MAWVAAVLCKLSARQGYAQQPGSGSVSVVQPGAPGTPSKRLPASTSAVAPRRYRRTLSSCKG